MTTTATEQWRRMVRDLVECAPEVGLETRAHEARSAKTIEHLGVRSEWPMDAPLVLCPKRNVGLKYALAEFIWIASGSNLLKPVSKYASYLKRFSDDGVTLTGAYGPPFIDQLPYVTGTLERDPSSRQAVATFWRPRPGISRDIPCTLALQWLIREDVLHCIASMRSSDAWLGVPYDVFTFSMLSAIVALRLKATSEVKVKKLGRLVLNQGSGHLYKIDIDPARECAGRLDARFTYLPLNLEEFADDAEFIDHCGGLLHKLTDPTVPLSYDWLKEMPFIDGE